ncbi:MAG: peptidoglycan-binding protein [Dehalococcoidia bacterium]|nr:peptidoglycan-binding protein [Dehalococcoidia bacterium]
MILYLANLPATLRGPDDEAYRGMVPKRARFLHPDAARSLLGLEAATGGLVYTDIFRSAEASLAARSSKRGVQPPGYSAHNYGLAVDLDVGAVLRSHRWRYPELVEAMGAHGWYCHRRDLSSTGAENWHFSFLGDPAHDLVLADSHDRSTWSQPVEARILSYYGADLVLDAEAVQEALAKLRLYSGEIDGKIGPLSREAICAFQRTWDLTPTGAADARTQRTLAYCAAEKKIVDLAPLVA